MKKSVKIITLFIFAVSLAAGSSQNIAVENENKKEQMKSIHFIPEEFNNIKLGYYETRENICSPKFKTGIKPINNITINTPDKIISNIKSKEFMPIIPVCIAHMVSLRRGFKYYMLSAMILHIRKLDEETVYSGEVVDKNLKYEYPILPPHYAEMEEERIIKEEEAQKYRDDELNEGQAAGGYMNINLMEYVDFPFELGKYEIFLSYYGLESNHTIVEIVEQ